MNITFSNHAAERMIDRGISNEIILMVVDNPDTVINETNCKSIYQKVIEEENTKYLYRAFINICKSPKLVITAYKTSKIEKYEH